MANKNWKTVSLKKSLLNEINKIAETKDITPTTLINQILWIYIDHWKFEHLEKGDIFFIGIPMNLWNKFNAEVKRTGKSMSQVLEEGLKKGMLQDLMETGVKVQR